MFYLKHVSAPSSIAEKKSCHLDVISAPLLPYLFLDTKEYTNKDLQYVTPVPDHFSYHLGGAWNYSPHPYPLSLNGTQANKEPQNDACLPGSAQHVPLEEYIANLKAIVQHDVVERHGTKVILIVPAPVDEYSLDNDQRTAANTKRYADACRQVGRELDLRMVDLWAVFMERAGWEEGTTLAGSKERERNTVLKELLSDGLHFTSEAYSILFQELIKVIRLELPEESPEALPMVFPAWSDVLVGNPETS